MKRHRAVEAARDTASTIGTTVGGAIGERAEAVAGPQLATVRDVAGQARDRAAPQLAHARDVAMPYLAQARDAAAPKLARARHRAQDTLVGEVLPRVSAGVAAGMAATEPAREEAARRGTATIAALAGRVDPPRRGHRKLKAVLIIGILGAAGAAAYRAWKLPHASDDWVSADAYSDGDIPGMRRTEPAGSEAAAS